MAMISGGDESARNAFRAYLRDESSQLSIISTEEMSAADVLEVRNLGDAIERAERALRESSRPRDMFAELGDTPPATLRSPLSSSLLEASLTPLPIPTDDASGPAIYAKPTLTPIPPALVPAPTSTRPLPIIMVPTPNEEDAFMQPAGRMRHFAEETLDGYRPESTMEIKRGARRKTATVLVGILLGLLAIAFGAGVVLACMPTASPAKIEPKTEAKPSVAAPSKTDEAPSVRTMNVNDLPSAR
jgi:hypothetical protein